jgi:hypothetical protein
MATAFRRAWSGTTDANGNFTQTIALFPAYQANVTVSGLASGAPAWAVSVAGAFLLPATGPSVAMGPFNTQPADQITIQATGATASTSIQGTLWGYVSQVSDGSDLPVVSAIANSSTTEISGGSITADITGPVEIINAGSGPVDVAASDNGLAGSIVSAISIMEPYATPTFALTTGATTTIAIGQGGAQGIFPSQVGSWMLQIVGMGGSWTTTPMGVRLWWQGQDGSGNMIYTRQRDSSQYIYGTITATGDVDAPLIEWQITLPTGAPTGCIARFFFSAAEIDDEFYDTAIYGPAFSDYQSNTIGMDGVLVSNSSTLAGGANATYAFPTYRGAVQYGVQMGQAGHGSFGERDYTGSVLRDNMNFPISSSGAGRQLYIAWIGGIGNTLTLFNDDSGASNTFFQEIRAIKNLV